MKLEQLRDERVLPVESADVGVAREVSRQRRLTRLLLLVLGVGAWLWISSGSATSSASRTCRTASARPCRWCSSWLLVATVMVVPFLVAGRSPHVRFRPEDIDVSLDDVKGCPSWSRRRSAPSTCSWLTPLSGRRWAVPRERASCSRGRRAPERRTWPRRWPTRPGCRFSSCRRRRSSRCSTGRPTGRSVRTSPRCAKRPARRAGPSGSSRRSTPSAPPGAAWAAAGAARASPAWSTSC